MIGNRFGRVADRKKDKNDGGQSQKKGKGGREVIFLTSIVGT